MSNVKTVSLGKQSVRYVLYQDKKYFYGADLARALGYKDINRAIRQHVDAQAKTYFAHKDLGDIYTELWNSSRDYGTKVMVNVKGVAELLQASSLALGRVLANKLISAMLTNVKHTDSEFLNVLLE